MVNYFLIGFACLVLGFIIGWFAYKTKVVELSDDKPVDEYFVSNAMKLSNELKDYIYEKDGKLYLRVVKSK
jgi:uncharacterized protein YneF (UPF0154 family)